MAAIDRYLSKVFHADAFDLLKTMPVESVDAVITDAMYGTASVRYEWGTDPAKGDPITHWQYHQPIYQECLRVLKPGGVLAWGQGMKFYEHFASWFGGHRVWPLTRFSKGGVLAVGNIWVVQNRERQPIEVPLRDTLVICDRAAQLELKALHPCPKPVEEMAWIIEALTKPGDVILDCFCGLGSTLCSAEQLGRRWIGCDRSRRYCQIALRRLKQLREHPLQLFLPGRQEKTASSA
jgi:site-specific DNA-methyltransferase (adenine-specific)